MLWTSITDQRAPAAACNAGSKAIYTPVSHIEPYEGNAAAALFDLSSSARCVCFHMREALVHPHNTCSRLSTLERAARTRETELTPPIRLVQETEQQSAVLMLQAVHE